ncbi:minor tail protein [Gordonia phage WilliamBoone]|nr:minor tail protein [Gordonia phage WilliamBoone]
MNEGNKHLAAQLFEWLNVTGDIVDLLGIVGTIQEWVDAALQALGGNFSALSNLVGELTNNAPPGWEWISDLSSWNPIGDLIAGLQTMLNQIGEIVRGVVVTPINNVVSHFKDWFLGLVGWQGNTTDKHQELTNMVWTGATTQTAEEDLTEAQVRDAVAALKARSEALRSENELRYRSAVPLWQGLVPGGDVTCDLNTVSVRDNWSIPITGTSGPQGFPGHDHGPGSYVANLRLATNASTTPAAGASMGPFAPFRARSDVPRNIVTFLARATGSVTSGYVSLWSYSYDTDKWLCVARSADFMSQVPGTDSYGWVDAQLLEEYTPSVGELMAVRWSTAGTGTLLLASSLSAGTQDHQFLIPAYHSVPYGTAAMVAAPTSPAVGQELSLTDPNQWWSGKTPFAQIAPDLGQSVLPRPQYWFDDFNASDPNAYTFSANGARIQDGHFEFWGTSSVPTVQYLIYRGQMATANLRIEATAKGHHGREMFMRLGCTSNGTSGLSLTINAESESTTQVLLQTVSPTDPGAVTTRHTVTGVPFTSTDRWALEFVDATKTYIVYRNGSFVTSWPDPGNLAVRGKGKRSGGLGVTRSFFLDSGAWDDFLLYDVTSNDTEPE